MAKSKSKNRRQAYPRLSPAERLLRMKAEKFLRVEKSFWKKRYEIESQYHSTAEALGLENTRTMPENLASIVWGLNDGVAFVRYITDSSKKGDVEFRAAQISLERWGDEGLYVPTSHGEVSLAQIGLARGLATIKISNSSVNDIEIPYAEITYARYGSEDILEPDELAIVDFQLALLGNQFNPSRSVDDNQSQQTISTIEVLEKYAADFEALLSTSNKEEELQVFLKEHPFILHASAEIISKKKLGEDFITDFVLVSPSDQGPVYYLVEIERVDHKVLTKENSLSSPTNHAIKQTRDWDVWLESNKSYLQGKLPGFETPQYIVIIGRGNKMDETSKAYLRSYNREWKNIELLTYDDVLSRFKSVIASLKAATCSVSSGAT